MAKIKVAKPELRFKQILSKLGDGSVFPPLVDEMGKEALRVGTENASTFKNVKGRSWKKLKSGGFPSWIAGTIALVKKGMGFAIESTHRAGIFIISGAKRRNSKWKLPARSFAPKREQLTGNFQSVLETGINFINKLLGG